MAGEAMFKGQTGRTLVVGAAGGLGRSLLERFSGIPFVRGNDPATLERDYFDTVVHCAANANGVVDAEQAFRFVDDNILLTERLTRIPHGLFIFISSIDVYPADGTARRETDQVRLDAVRNPYGGAKLLAESIVRKRCARSLVLRPATLLGRYARPNNIIRLLTQDDPRLTLTAGSRFNCLLHDDVADFIACCARRGETGVFNLGRRDEITLGEIAAAFGLTPRFGKIDYAAPCIDINKAAALSPGLQNGSMDAVRAFSASVIRHIAPPKV